MFILYNGDKEDIKRTSRLNTPAIQNRIISESDSIEKIRFVFLSLHSASQGKDANVSWNIAIWLDQLYRHKNIYIVIQSWIEFDD